MAWQRLGTRTRSEEHTSELQSRGHLVCRLLLEKKKNIHNEKHDEGCGRVPTEASNSSPRAAPRALLSGIHTPLFYVLSSSFSFFFFFFNDTATTEIYTLSLHDALPISRPKKRWIRCKVISMPSDT